jgi:DNA polymerase I
VSMTKRIFLLDKMSFVYRAYHAAARMPFQMTTKAGFPTGATYVFARMFKKLVADHKPEYMIACAEGGGSAFREAIFPAYKANRKSEGTPNELARQFPYLDRLLACYHFPTVSIEGYEADDVIGTLARKFYAADLENQIYIVTGDKDMFQLVNDRTFIVNPMKDLIADAQKVELIVGVPPAQVTDVMALRGDTVDNIPGAPGIGEKGSVAIVREFGSLTAALDRAAEVKRKAYRESLQNNRGMIELSHKLVTIATDAPIEANTVVASFNLNEGELKALYAELEFGSLLSKEALAAVEDFAEIVQPDVPKTVDTRTTMSKETADKLIDSLF